ncbi:DUF4172 domain-containing protein [Gluconobacter sp. Dm-73]|uniref:DUF4172 domain-containing protein n=1 Tax=Gluconobacter sp. Dm-73 TaxID=2799802 RepID=UPI0020137B40|nr:DUF4172 domain-containing protein [Gluconobacter sp. Dm-73]
MQHLDKAAKQQRISQEMVGSLAIEDEALNRASVQSSIARQLGFAPDKRRSALAEAGAAELMADFYRYYAAPLTDQILFDWHAPHIHFEATPPQRCRASWRSLLSDLAKPPQPERSL